MPEPRFLSLSRLLELHAESIAIYGGNPGVRDLSLLEFAIGQPRATFSGEYLHATIIEMAGAYLFHLVMNHPFVDGNKRAGAIAAFVFLEMNGSHLTAEQDAYRDLVLDVAGGKLDKTDVVVFFKRHVITSTPPAPTSEFPGKSSSATGAEVCNGTRRGALIPSGRTRLSRRGQSERRIE